MSRKKDLLSRTYININIPVIPMKKKVQSLSFEFFPPKTPLGKEKLELLATKLRLYSPEYFSVTFGAGGSTKDGTLEACLSLLKTKIEVCPHLSGIGSSKQTVKEILDQYKNYNFKRLVVLRGDLPSGIGGTGDFPYAINLIQFIKEIYKDYFKIEVAAYPEIHPEASSEDSDFKNFLKKIEAGASGAITQFFFEPEPYFQFIEKCRKKGLEVPIVPGIMPIHNSEALIRMAKNCGAKIPKWLETGLNQYTKEQDLIKFGIDAITDLCSKLIDFGIPSIHFYTVNREEPTDSIINNLNFRK